jgi:23S rRNA (guanosine2251-2'-O)-methyltransferase
MTRTREQMNAGRRRREERRDRFDERHGASGGRAGVSLLWGYHSVHAALSNPRRKVLRLLATENGWRRLEEAGVPARIAPEIVRAGEIDRLVPEDAVHQGLLLEAAVLPPLDEESLPLEGVLVVLDQVTDPHNVGAVLRSAAAFGAIALMTTNRHSPEATGVLAKAASGALDHVPLALVRNLADALERLKARGFQVVGLDSEAEADFETVPMRAPLALVLGAEGKGLRQRTAETCDALARLDLPGPIKSLNVSNAAALALATAHRRTRG